MAARTPSKAQVDRLGERLRRGELDEADLRLLDSYRESASDAYTAVFAAIRRLGYEPSGRPSKSTLSIVAKLQRESARLSQMQDIAGCRIVVPDLNAQDEAVARISEAFGGNVAVFDRRAKPSHGYRAVHLVVKGHGTPVEVQIRSRVQHLWAEMSEKLSDVAGIDVKYGGGSDSVRAFLTQTSDFVAQEDDNLARIRKLRNRIRDTPVEPLVQTELSELQADIEATIVFFQEAFQRFLDDLR